LFLSQGLDSSPSRTLKVKVYTMTHQEIWLQRNYLNFYFYANINTGNMHGNGYYGTMVNGI
jgi:hypothetical protein